MVKVMMMIRQERCGPALGSQIATGWSEGEKPEPGRNSKRKGAEESNRGSPDGGSGGREEGREVDRAAESMVYRKAAERAATSRAATGQRGSVRACGRACAVGRERGRKRHVAATLVRSRLAKRLSSTDDPGRALQCVAWRWAG